MHPPSLPYIIQPDAAEETHDFWRRIPLVRVAMRFRCDEDIGFPSFKGFSIYKAFVAALRECSCVMPHAQCALCSVRRSCAYFGLCATPPIHRGPESPETSSAPNPFVLRFPEDGPEIYRQGRRMEGEWILVGGGVRFLPKVVDAARLMGRRGLGQGAGRCTLREVRELGRSPLEGASLYRLGDRGVRPPELRLWKDLLREFAGSGPSLGDVRLRLHTPLRMKDRGKLVYDLEFHHLVRVLFHRAFSLACIHAPVSPDPGAFDFEHAMALAARVPVVRRKMHWKDWSHEIQTGKTGLMLGGVVGKVTFARVPRMFLELLAVGEWIHAGKAAGLGMGGYTMKVSPASGARMGKVRRKASRGSPARGDLR